MEVEFTHSKTVRHDGCSKPCAGRLYCFEDRIISTALEWSCRFRNSRDIPYEKWITAIANMNRRQKDGDKEKAKRLKTILQITAKVLTGMGTFLLGLAALLEATK